LTFLTIYTPTYRRPISLQRCIMSVAAQSERDYQHLVIEDTVGLGVDGMFRDVPNHHAAIEGEYVYFLCDDDVLADSHVVRDMRAFIEANDRPDVVMAYATIGPLMFPYPQCWQAEPKEGFVTLANWAVRAEVWRAVPYGNRYEGDYEFIAECWRRGYRFAWWDRLICRAPGWNRGAPEAA
jgi:hypothetical protein